MTVSLAKAYVSELSEIVISLLYFAFSPQNCSDNETKTYKTFNVVSDSLTLHPLPFLPFSSWQTWSMEQFQIVFKIIDRKNSFCFSGNIFFQT